MDMNTLLKIREYQKKQKELKSKPKDGVTDNLGTPAEENEYSE
jgi:hypothetical protein